MFLCYNRLKKMASGPKVKFVFVVGFAYVNAKNINFLSVSIVS